MSGKRPASRQGTVVLSAAQEATILLSIEDDGGAGNGCRRAAPQGRRAKGMMDGTRGRLGKDCYNLISHPGFRKTEISDVSDVVSAWTMVKDRIAQMNGMVEIDSFKGKGSKITMAAVDARNPADVDGDSRPAAVRVATGQRGRDL